MPDWGRGLPRVLRVCLGNVGGVHHSWHNVCVGWLSAVLASYLRVYVWFCPITLPSTVNKESPSCLRWGFFVELLLSAPVIFFVAFLTWWEVATICKAWNNVMCWYGNIINGRGIWCGPTWRAVTVTTPESMCFIHFIPQYSAYSWNLYSLKRTVITYTTPTYI